MSDGDSRMFRKLRCAFSQPTSAQISLTRPFKIKYCRRFSPFFVRYFPPVACLSGARIGARSADNRRAPARFVAAILALSYVPLKPSYFRERPCLVPARHRRSFAASNSFGILRAERRGPSRPISPPERNVAITDGIQRHPNRASTLSWRPRPTCQPCAPSSLHALPLSRLRAHSSMTFRCL